MSAGAITGTTSTKDLPEDTKILELTGGENPAEFLDMNGVTIMGLIAGMSDPDRIEGWRRAEIEHTDTEREVVLEALDRQEAALEDGQSPPIYHPIHDRYDPEQDPLVDDNGETENEETDAGAEEEDDGDEDDVQEDTDEAHMEHGYEVHPDANLEVGEVLVVNREETIEYVWPARADADEPYILREFDDGKQIDEATIGVDEAFRLVRLDSEKRRCDAVSVDTPLEAATATNGGGSA